MEKERNDFRKWVKDHKKQLIGTGICFGIILLSTFVLPYDRYLSSLWKELKRLITKPVEETGEKAVREAAAQKINHQTASEVSKHIRNLHEGWHASAQKIREAAANGFQLLEGQTWVKDYPKGALRS